MGLGRRVHLIAGVGALALQMVGLYAPGSPDTDIGFPGLDKLLHVTLFALPVWLLLRAGMSRMVVLVGALTQAVVSEIAQRYWIPYRGGDVFDGLADLVGVGVGFWLASRAGRLDRPPVSASGDQMSSSPRP